jgi:hypothetical protein
MTKPNLKICYFVSDGCLCNRNCLADFVKISVLLTAQATINVEAEPTQERKNDSQPQPSARTRT